MDMELGGGAMVSPMTREQIFDKVCDIMKNEALVQQDVEILTTSLMADSLGMDSLDLIDLTMEVEREFGVKIPDDDFYKMKTYSVGEFCDVIESVLRK
jgi:acyl carrier protein